MFGVFIVIWSMFTTTFSTQKMYHYYLKCLLGLKHRHFTIFFYASPHCRRIILWLRYYDKDGQLSKIKLWHKMCSCILSISMFRPLFVLLRDKYYNKFDLFCAPLDRCSFFPISFFILLLNHSPLPPSPISIPPPPPTPPWTKSVEMRPTNDICHKRVGMAG